MALYRWGIRYKRFVDGIETPWTNLVVRLISEGGAWADADAVTLPENPANSGYYVSDTIPPDSYEVWKGATIDSGVWTGRVKNIGVGIVKK